jgi:cytochrome c biogenesis protein CcdA/thiol-disulfide isomerase/thioredoxin
VALLIGIAFIAGVVTAISPCVLPVLPVVFAGGATGGPRRPYAIVLGLVCSFTAFTLAATALLSALGLPNDLLRNIAIGVVMAVGLALLLPWLGRLLERPFQALGRRRPGDAGGGFLLGVSLGLLYTPCAGPVIAAVAFVAATERFSPSAVFVTLAYALGSGVVLLALAVAARRGFSLAPVRTHASFVRRALGALVVTVAVLMAFGLDLKLQTKVPGYTQALQGLEESAAAASRIDSLTGAEKPKAAETAGLEDFGPAPEFTGINLWLNSEALTLAELRGKIVLIDFWTYSCVNCLRTLPYLKRWHETYADAGLVIIGVHTPEFAFERDPANVRDAVADLGLEYPIALDNEYGTWNAWGNRYWPAKYFVDRGGHVRFAHFGEGAYEESEEVIRTLLAEADLPKPVSGTIEDRTPTAPQTPETYLGYARVDRLVGSPVHADEEAVYELPDLLPEHGLGFGGRWRIESERAIAGEGARLRLNYLAGEVFLVLGAPEGGTVDVYVNDRFVKSVQVKEHRLYDIAASPPPTGAGEQFNLLELRFSPGVQAYAFTFGA